MQWSLLEFFLGIGWISFFGWTGVLSGAEWQGGWYLDGGGYWAARVQLTITNRTDRPMEGLLAPVRI
ncbi:MAG TPA: hypothetical protein PLQ00_08405, partial [Thermoguttaceae bacterium]|nr:hypothetical protein [Thermoguttaceae bacterium]